MKRTCVILGICTVIALCAGCAAQNTPVSLQKATETGIQAGSVKQQLKEKNETYLRNSQTKDEISSQRREELAKNGQKPYAVVVTCSDSRVVPEHLFSAGIGELFVIRTAGNVIGDFELGSIEYGVSHLQAKAVIVLVHQQCGAVQAAMEGYAEGKTKAIVDEIAPVIKDAKDEREAEKSNTLHSMEKIKKSKIIQKALKNEGLELISAIYDIESGKVTFLPEQ